MTKSLLDCIGNTPIVGLSRINKKPKVTLLGKLEGMNPGGSVKDRAAFYMIKNAVEKGILDQNKILIEATSGNTGIALAMIARLFGFKIELVMPENATKERIQTMEAYGAKVILTPKEQSMEGAIDYAQNKIKNEKYVMLDQFSNEDNYKSHYYSTGPEIWTQTEGKITHFVSSMGTTGTIMGVSKFLKEKNSNIQIIGVQPEEGSQIPGIRRWPDAYVPKIFDKTRIDKIIDVSQSEATNMAKVLAKEEAIFSGMSSGGAVAAAIKLINELDTAVIVCIICDRGDRYLSSELFN